MHPPRRTAPQRRRPGGRDTRGNSTEFHIDATPSPAWGVLELIAACTVGAVHGAGISGPTYWGAAGSCPRPQTGAVAQRLGLHLSVLGLPLLVCACGDALGCIPSCFGAVSPAFLPEAGVQFEFVFASSLHRFLDGHLWRGKNAFNV